MTTLYAVAAGLLLLVLVYLALQWLLGRRTSVLHVPFWLPGDFAACTIHRQCLILSPRFKRLREDIQDRTIEHEMVHMAQRLQDGETRFTARYLFSAHWCARYEMEAYRVQLAYYVAHGSAREIAARAIVDQVREVYFPRFAFWRRPPPVELMLAWLMEEA